MKNLSLTLNAVLIVAVGILYYLHFKGDKTGNSGGGDKASNVVVSSPSGIVYINSDSLLDQYDFYKNQKEGFEQQGEKIKDEIKSESDKFQKEVELYQHQAVGMTDKEKAEKEQQLGMKQQDLVQRKDAMLKQLDEEQDKSSEELYTRLHDFLKKYNQGKNYSYVLGVQKGGGILFANDSLNITKDVVDGLNKEYHAK